METVNIGNPVGSVAPGDTVLCGGEYVTVRRVIIYPPGTHSGSIIGDRFHAIEVITDHGSRWAGGVEARIGSDLRAHWTR